MKILHIAPERSAAFVAAPVVHGIAHNVTLTWVPSPAAALEWLQANREAAAVIVELHSQSCASFVEQLRGQGLTTPVVVVSGSARLEAAVDAFNSGADGYVVADASIETTLPRAVAAAIERERGRRQLLTQTLARLADDQARQSASLARETRISRALQQRLLELESGLRNADERRASEAVSFADQLAKRHAEFAASLAQAAQSRDVVAAELSVAKAALDEARQARKADAAAAAEQLRRREEELRAEVAEAVAGRTALETALADAAAAHQETRQRAAADLAAANERQAALDDLLTQEADRRKSLERKLVAAEAAHQEANRRFASELTKAAAALAELQVGYDAAVHENAAARVAFGRQMDEAKSALERAVGERAADAAAAASHLAAVEAELGARLADAAAERTALERTLTEAQAAHQQAMERAEQDLAAAAARTADLEERLALEASHVASLQAQYDTAAAEHAVTLAEAARGRDRLLYVISAHRRRTREQTARLEAQLTGQRTSAARELRAKDDEIRQIQLEHEALRGLFGTTRDELQQSESELQRVSTEHGQIRESFDRLQSAFQTLEQIAGEHAAERSRLAAVVADRETQLSAQAERHHVADQAAQDAFAKLQATLRQTVDASAAESARLQQEIDALRRELDANRTHAESLRGVAERVPDLQTQLEQSQNARRRQFEWAPYALCRCSQDGAITDANHAFVTLLGCRRVDELRNVDFVTAARDGAGDLGWLLERARKTRKTETVETPWKTRDGRHLVIRLQALAATTGSIDIVAEDITSVRALEERLRQAQRMEAVGRLASEVAGTCDGLLADIGRGAHEWLASLGTGDPLRRHAESLITDVTRTSTYLRQLAVYGKEQVRALEPVSADRVLRDLAPVLKRLLGDSIELVLPKSGGSFNVDVEAERLERVLINVAGYARERMTGGGLVRIDLATTALGRRFVGRYANVRPGEHVLITVTELPAAGEPHGASERGSQSSDKPGVDLRVLVDLIASCGGHLWVDAHPAGKMVVKIHLPKPPAGRATESRGGRLSRWFRSMSPVSVGA